MKKLFERIADLLSETTASVCGHIRQQIRLLRTPSAGSGEKRVTVRKRILVFVVLFTLALWITLTLTGYAIISANEQRSTIQNGQDRLSYISSAAESRLEQVNAFLKLTQSSSTIASFAESSADSSDLNRRRMEAYNYINDFYKYNSTLFSYSERIIVSGYASDSIVQTVPAARSVVGVTSRSISSLPFFEQYISSGGICFDCGFVDNPVHVRPDTVLPLIRPIYHHAGNETTGFIYIALSPEFITDLLDEYEDSGTFYVLLGTNRYIYENGRLSAVDMDISESRYSGRYKLSSDTALLDIRRGDGRSTALSCTVFSDDFRIIQEIDTRTVRSNIGVYILLFIFSLFVAGLIGFIIARYLRTSVTVPMAQLRDRVVEVSKGDFTRDPSIEWENELGDIGRSVNVLAENVRGLIDQKVEDEKQKRLYEYRMLQSQINPHFMYNTLNTIKWMAVTQGATGIEQMTTALSRLLRQISNGTSHLVPLSEELSLIGDFFTIQQYRYGGTISLDYDIEDDILTKAKILRFTLQPLVENAIFHGIEPKGIAGKIIIHIFRVNDDVQIDITDNGVGMTEETIERILSGEDSGKSSFFKDFGISSVNSRLKYEFGEKYGLSAQSVPGEYTRMTILIPFGSDPAADAPDVTG